MCSIKRKCLAVEQSKVFVRFTTEEILIEHPIRIMSTKPRILVIGASIAGLTVANGLRRTGLCEVIVLERSSQSETGRLPKNGGGIGLHEESVKMLHSLGVTTDYALPMRIQEDRDRTGRIIRKGKIPFYSAFWGDVHRCLLESLLKAGAVVLYDKNVTSIEETDSGVSLGLSDGEASFSGDCLIAADGILSTVRTLMFSNNSNLESDLIRHAGYYAWRGLVPQENLPPDTELMFRKGTFTIELSEKSHAILYYLPRGLNWLIYLNSNSDASSTYHRSHEVAGQITKTATEAELEEFYRAVEALYRPAILNVIKASRKPLPFTNQMYDRKLLSTVSTNRCILIGDAAHPSTPHHIRGSNMAIADGFILAKEFAHSLSSNADDLKDCGVLKEIFRRFENQRLKHCNDIVELAARIGRVRQGVFCDTQGPFWDTFCQSFELTELLGDTKDFCNVDGCILD